MINEWSLISHNLKNKGECSCFSCVIISARHQEERLKKEQAFWHNLKDNLKLDFIRRVEHSIESGWPDVHYCHSGHSGWIELKAEEKFPSKIDYEPAQPIWLNKYWNAGGNCFTFLKVIEESKIYVYAGLYSSDLNQKGGCKKVTPMIEINMNNKGWLELYELFSTDPTLLKRYQRKS